VIDYEKLGKLYLGKHLHPQTGEPDDVPVLYDSKDLTTHAVCVGMTGSGKTGLCLTLLEEAAIDGIPALCIDPKGDLGNLMLTFPELRPSDFEPWIDPAEAERKGRSVAEHAEAVSTMFEAIAVCSVPSPLPKITSTTLPTLTARSRSPSPLKSPGARDCEPDSVVA